MGGGRGITKLWKNIKLSEDKKYIENYCKILEGFNNDVNYKNCIEDPRTKEFIEPIRNVIENRKLMIEVWNDIIKDKTRQQMVENYIFYGDNVGDFNNDYIMYYTLMTFYGDKSQSKIMNGFVFENTINREQAKNKIIEIEDLLNTRIMMIEEYNSDIGESNQVDIDIIGNTFDKKLKELYINYKNDNENPSYRVIDFMNSFISLKDGKEYFTIKFNVFFE